jgi:hypothetical protein
MKGVWRRGKPSRDGGCLSSCGEASRDSGAHGESNGTQLGVVGLGNKLVASVNVGAVTVKRKGGRKVTEGAISTSLSLPSVSLEGRL